VGWRGASLPGAGAAALGGVAAGASFLAARLMGWGFSLVRLGSVGSGSGAGLAGSEVGI